MPVILKIEHADGQRTAVWEITEDENSLLKIASLTESDLRAFSLIPNPGRRLEWLAVRALLKEFYPVAPTIDYYKNGKPLLVTHSDPKGIHSDKISISHSGKIVGIALHSAKDPGIDIEIVSARIFKIASRYLGEQEKAYLGATPSAEELTIVWGAKEVMFKICGFEGVSFKNNFMVKRFTLSSKGSLEGVIPVRPHPLPLSLKKERGENMEGNNPPSIPMEYMKIRDFILVQTDYR